MDLLHPAGRLWQRRLRSCRLISLEQKVLGLYRTEEDVPGHLIAELYLQYVQTGLAGDMRRVFYHNLEDIVTMVGLADQLSRALGEEAGSAAPAYLHGLDLGALGRAHEAAGRLALGEPHYCRALEHVRHSVERSDLFSMLGNLYKRQGRWSEAAETWQTWLSSVTNPGITPYVELAKYCEWQLHDLPQAEMWAAWALHTVSTDGVSSDSQHIEHELLHRLDRLRRKQQGSAVDSAEP